MKKLLLVSTALLILSFGAFAQDPAPTPEGATPCADERDTNPGSGVADAAEVDSGAGSQTLSDPAAD